MEEKYTRYGIDWQNEVMKNPKMMIVQMLRSVTMERDELQRRQTKRARQRVAGVCKYKIGKRATPAGKASR